MTKELTKETPKDGQQRKTREAKVWHVSRHSTAPLLSPPAFLFVDDDDDVVCIEGGFGIDLCLIGICASLPIAFGPGGPHLQPIHEPDSVLALPDVLTIHFAHLL